jgi:hypothetical protein
MPINTKMAKSGVKNVFKKKRSNIGGRLNRAARQVSTSEAANLSPGVAGLLDPIDKRKNRISHQKHSAIIGNRRRRQAAGMP